MPSPIVARRLLRAKDYVDQHYVEPINVNTLARVAHQSPAHFARQFQQAFTETPHQYLLSRRLERAASLLRSTDYTAGRVCTMVGFTSVGSFTTRFGRVYGVTPAEYRRQHLPQLIQRVVPPCVLGAVERPQMSRIREQGG